VSTGLPACSKTARLALAGLGSPAAHPVRVRTARKTQKTNALKQGHFSDSFGVRMRPDAPFACPRV
jgi:hypothetical protein